MLDELFIKGSKLLNGNIPPDHLKLAFSIFATYPSAILFKHIRSTQTRHLFSTAYSVFIMAGILRLYDGLLHITATAVFTFLFMKYFKGKNGPWINFIFVMVSMSLCHIQRQIQGYEGDTTLDYSGALMIVTIKLTSFGFNISDGQRMTKEEEKKLLTPHNEQMVIELYPTWIEYFGWIYFFGGFLAGPTCEYMDYHRFIHDKTKRNTFRPALKVFLKSLVFIVILVSFGTTFNYFAALKSEWKLQYTSLPSRIGFIQLSSILTRCKYYCVWSLAEGACILSGFGFNGYDEDKKEKWDKLTNVHVLNCEFAQSYKSLAENWNIGANNWLRHYVYLRLKSGSSGATLITYVVSSMWHGFLPGYYMFFMSVSVLQIFARRVRRTVRPLIINTNSSMIKTAYDITTCIASMGIINMFTPCFDLLYVSRVVYVWQQVYYCHFMIIGLSFFIFYCSKPYLYSLQKRA